MKCNDALHLETYTYLQCENESKYNAPHHFEVCAIADDTELVKIDMQEGPIKEVGLNGCSNEDLLAIVKIRLEGFQKSKFKCRENALALTKIEEALMWLNLRTKKRELENVEGTSKVIEEKEQLNDPTSSDDPPSIEPENANPSSGEDTPESEMPY